jgi:hypothetical protein
MRKRFAIIWAMLLSCETKESQNPEIIDFDRIEVIPADLKIEKVILLESDTTALLGENARVQYDESGFFIMNKGKAKGIHHFSPSGQHLGLAASIGEAPGQFFQIEDFKLIRNSLFLISGRGNQLNLHRISINHELEATVEIPYYAFSFEPSENGDFWFYSGYYQVAGDHRLFVTDGSGKLKNRLLQNTVPPDGEFGGHAFFAGDRRILFHEPLKTSVWEIVPGDTLREAYRFDFGNYTAPEEYWEQDLFVEFGKLMTKGVRDISYMVESDRYFLADIVTFQDMQKSKSLFLRNKESCQQYKINVNEEELGHFYSPIGIEADQIVFYAYAGYLVRNRENLTLSDEAKVSLADLTEDDNPVILYAKIPE